MTTYTEIAEKIWSDACERVNIKPSHVVTRPDGERFYITGPTRLSVISWPPLGSSDAAMKILEWLVRNRYIDSLHVSDENEFTIVTENYQYTGDENPDIQEVTGYPLSLALAKAVLAIADKGK